MKSWAKLFYLVIITRISFEATFHFQISKQIDPKFLYSQNLFMETKLYNCLSELILKAKFVVDYNFSTSTHLGVLFHYLTI